MRLLPKIVVAVLTTSYSIAALLTLWSMLRLEKDPILSYDPQFLGSVALLGLILLVFYSNHLAENESVGRMSRILWFIRFYLFSFIAFPIYWIAFVMRSNGVEEELEEE